MNNKRFDQNLKEKYDPIGKKLSIEIMCDVLNAKFITKNEEEDNGTFGDGFWDLKFLLKNKNIITVEAEMKDEKWWGTSYGFPPFKYKDIDIPFRKIKNKAELHIVISTCQNFAFMVLRKHMDQEFASRGKPHIKPVRVPGSTKYGREPFFRTSVKKGKFVHRYQDNIWRFC